MISTEFRRNPLKIPRRKMEDVSKCLKSIAPPLDFTTHKGSSGRIGILGGSVDYTGAPFYSSMAALRTGADLAYVLTSAESSQAIKAYSPELMVSSMYVTDRIHTKKEQDDFVNRVTSIFPRLHGIVIGPGLGRNQHVLQSVKKIVERAKEIELPLVLDADGLFLLSRSPDMLKSYHNAVITPNVVEYRRLCKAVNEKPDIDISRLTKCLNGPIVIRKGRVDEICGSIAVSLVEKEEIVMKCDALGSPRRPGGLGDFLAGTAIVLLSWSVRRFGSSKVLNHVQACHAATTIVREASRRAFAKRKRGMIARDLLSEISDAFETYCPST